MKESKIIENFLNKISSKYPYKSEKYNIIEKACLFAKKAHSGQVRKIGQLPYLIHPIEIAAYLFGKFNDFDLTVAAILHDTVEDCEDVSMKDIYDKFGDEVGLLVNAVTKADIHCFFKNPKIKFTDKIEQLLHGGIIDIRCIILKLADRGNNIRSIEGLKPEKQIRMTFETQALYQPLVDIIRYHDARLSPPDMQKLFDDYLLDNDLNSISELKENLYNVAFHNFDEETFDLVYKNTHAIIWKIEDKNIFEKLISQHGFEEKIEVISMKQISSGEFSCTFKYKKGQVFKNVSQIKISDFKH